MEKQNLDILPGGVLPVIHCSQGDIGRQFQINLFADNAPYVLDGTEELTLDGHKEDGNIFSYSLPTTTGSTITISTEEQMTACAGNTICEIRIFKGTTRLGTCNFIMQIEEGPSNGTPSESTLQALDEIRAEIQQAVEDSESYADTSKAWAVGPNGSGSGSDINNSKYYSQQSANSATNSANSATAAHTSETNAARSATNAANSATNSANSATTATQKATLAESWAVGGTGTRTGENTNNAKYYATQASTSATNAANSASTATTKANEASTSATNAANSATSASTSANTATTKASEASTSATNAANSASAASTSETNAASSASAASTSETNAKNWAVGPSGSGSGTNTNNAKYYATQASTSATNAATSATNASNSATAASNSASSANTSANNASASATTATNAKNNAISAKNDAVAAKNAAEAAQQKIENMTATASQLPEGSSPTVTKSEVGGVVNLAFGIPKGDTGSTGKTGADGVSPEVTIGSIIGGHSVTITDAYHPEGQTFNVKDGAGVPAGGTAGQILTKVNSVDYNTEWRTPSESSQVYGRNNGRATNIGTYKVGNVDYRAERYITDGMISSSTNVDGYYYANIALSPLSGVYDSQGLAGALNRVLEYEVILQDFVEVGHDKLPVYTHLPGYAYGTTFSQLSDVSDKYIECYLNRYYNSLWGTYMPAICIRTKDSSVAESTIVVNIVYYIRDEDNE